MLIDALMATAQLIVPVYPAAGVIVTVEVPELPSATVRLVAASEKDLELDEEPIVSVKLPDEPW